MKKLLWAALLALPCLTISAPRSAADGCLNLSGGFRLKICYAGWLKCGCEPFPCNGGGFGGCPGVGCCGAAPGPWYTYWPTGGGYMSGYDSPGWVYDNHFQTPAPVPYGPAAPPSPMDGASYGASFQPAGYYPSYWYGH
jgi:hypothetical protein